MFSTFSPLKGGFCNKNPGFCCKNPHKRKRKRKIKYKEKRKKKKEEKTPLKTFNSFAPKGRRLFSKTSACFLKIISMLFFEIRVGGFSFSASHFCLFSSVSTLNKKEELFSIIYQRKRKYFPYFNRKYLQKLKILFIFVGDVT